MAVGHVMLPGSERVAVPGARATGRANPNATIPHRAGRVPGISRALREPVRRVAEKSAGADDHVRGFRL
jgi:hypothetical protein